MPAFRCWWVGTDAPDYQADDLGGEGARQSGGRWNRRGTPVVYASSTRALACLETVVHLASGDPLPLNRYLVEISIPSDLWKARTIFDPAAGVGWDAEPAGQASLDWGTAWARKLTTAVAEVPSVIVPEELNYLINPGAPGAERVTAEKKRKWTYDARLRTDDMG